MESRKRLLKSLVSFKVVENFFGGKRALLKLVKERLLLIFGRYSQYSKIEWANVDRVVFICKGNINRSAFASEYCRKKGVKTASCGLNAETGLAASVPAIRNSKDRGVSLEQHRTTNVTDFVFEDDDLVVAFEPVHLTELLEHNIEKKIQITLIGLWGRGKFIYIQDPICRKDEYFQFCFDRIERGANGLIEEKRSAK